MCACGGHGIELGGRGREQCPVLNKRFYELVVALCRPIILMLLPNWVRDSATMHITQCSNLIPLSQCHHLCTFGVVEWGQTTKNCSGRRRSLAHQHCGTNPRFSDQNVCYVKGNRAYPHSPCPFPLFFSFSFRPGGIYAV